MTDTIILPRSVVEQALEHLTCPVDEPVREAFRAALEQPQDHPEQHLDMVPEGWKLVPVEPADPQIRAAQDTWWNACNCETYWDQIYAAMIAAAPQPPAVKESLTADQPQSVTNCHQSQPKREPLTDEEIRKIGNSLSEEHRFHSRMFARAIERAVWDKSNG